MIVIFAHLLQTCLMLFRFYSLFAALLCGVSLCAAQSQVTLELIDAQTKASIPGWVRILDANEVPLAISDQYSRGVGLRGNHPARRWYFCSGPTIFPVPKGEVFIEAISGINSEKMRRKLDFRFFDRLTVKLPVRELLPLRDAGWVAGNTHLHLKNLEEKEADQYLEVVPQGDRLDVVFVSYLERAGDDETYVSNRYRPSGLSQRSSDETVFGFGQEHRHNFGAWSEGFGHVMFLDIPDLIRPVSVGSGIAGEGFDFPPLRRGMEAAHEQGGTVIWCHNGLGFEDVPNWLSGRIDVQNIFDGGSRGDYSETFYRYLDVGMDVPFSTGTDWFIYDFAQVFVKASKGVSTKNWLKALREGRSFITNGPLLTFEMYEGEIGQMNRREIGDRLNLEPGQSIRISGTAVGRGDFGRLELIHNGIVRHSVEARRTGNQFKAALAFAQDISEPGWFALRTSAQKDANVTVPSPTPIRGSGGNVNEMGEALFSHTSPIYVDVAGKRRFNPEAAQELEAQLEISIESIQAQAMFASPEDREFVLGIYRDALTDLKARLRSAARSGN